MNLNFDNSSSDQDRVTVDANGNISGTGIGINHIGINDANQNFIVEQENHTTADTQVVFTQEIVGDVSSDVRVTDAAKQTKMMVIPYSNVFVCKVEGQTDQCALMHLRANLDADNRKWYNTFEKYVVDAASSSLLPSINDGNLDDMYLLHNNSEADPRGTDLNIEAYSYARLMDTRGNAQQGEYYTFLPYNSTTESGSKLNFQEVVGAEGMTAIDYQNQLFRVVWYGEEQTDANGVTTIRTKAKVFKFVDLKEVAYDSVEMLTNSGTGTDLKDVIFHDYANEGDLSSEVGKYIVNLTNDPQAAKGGKINFTYNKQVSVGSKVGNKKMKLQGVWVEWTRHSDFHTKEDCFNGDSQYDDRRTKHDPLFPFRKLGIVAGNDATGPCSIRTEIVRNAKCHLLTGRGLTNVGHTVHEGLSVYDKDDLQYKGLTDISEVSPVSVAGNFLLCAEPRDISMSSSNVTAPLSALTQQFTDNPRFVQPLVHTILERIENNLTLSRMHIGESAKKADDAKALKNDVIIYCDTFKYRLEYGISAKINNRHYTLTGGRMGASMNLTLKQDPTGFRGLGVEADVTIGATSNGDIEWPIGDAIKRPYKHLLSKDVFNRYAILAQHLDFRGPESTGTYLREKVLLAHALDAARDDLNDSTKSDIKKTLAMMRIVKTHEGRIDGLLDMLNVLMLALKRGVIIKQADPNNSDSETTDSADLWNSLSTTAQAAVQDTFDLLMQNDADGVFTNQDSEAKWNAVTDLTIKTKSAELKVAYLTVVDQDAAFGLLRTVVSMRVYMAYLDMTSTSVEATAETNALDLAQKDAFSAALNSGDRADVDLAHEAKVKHDMSFVESQWNINNKAAFDGKLINENNDNVELNLLNTYVTDVYVPLVQSTSPSKEELESEVAFWQNYRLRYYRHMPRIHDVLKSVEDKIQLLIGN